LRAYLIEQFNPDYAIFQLCKKRVRKLFPLLYGAHSDHQHSDAILYAQALFSQNTIHFFNHRQIGYMPRFQLLFDQFKTWLASAQIDTGNCCIVNAATQAVFGVKDCDTLEFIYAGAKQQALSPTIKDIINVNNRSDYRSMIEEIVTNSDYHFYYRGVKFACLPD
jgi:hypothetical protein